MKFHPEQDVEFFYTGNKMHVDFIMLENGSFGIKVINNDNARLNIDLDKCRMPPVQSVHLGFCDQDGIDFLAALRKFLVLLDS